MTLTPERLARFTWSPDDIVIVKHADAETGKKASDDAEPRDSHGRWTGGGYWSDNPGKPKWLAENLNTPTAGYRRATVPAAQLAALPGKMGEQDTFDPDKVAKLADSIRKNGFNADEAVFVIVEHDGHPFIYEGNHRARAALAAGVQNVPVEVRYLGGSEALPGVWRPEPPVKAAKFNQVHGDHGHFATTGAVKPTQMIGSDHGKPFIGVPADAVPLGQEAYLISLANGAKEPHQQSGAPIRGVAIAWNDPLIPKTLYHVTTNLPAVLASGYLRASGVGGLGGDNQDQIVSMTTNPDIANQLVPDLQLCARVAQIPYTPAVYDGHGNYAAPGAAAYSQAVFKLLDADGAKYGFHFGGQGARQNPDGISKTLGPTDWLHRYFQERDFKAHVLDPMIMTSADLLKQIDPDKVGVVTIPRQNLNTGALTTNFDVGKYATPGIGLDEIRQYGDVPLGPQAAKSVFGELAAKGFLTGLAAGIVLDGLYQARQGRDRALSDMAADHYRDTHDSNGNPEPGW